MNLTEARDHVGDTVVYRPGPRRYERGVIKSVTSSWVFVLYEGNTTAKATSAGQIALVTQPLHSCQASCWEYLQQHGVDDWSRGCDAFKARRAAEGAKA